MPTKQPEIYAIGYSSVAAPDLTSEQLSHILSSAQAFNSQHDLSGALSYRPGSFVQFLEGRRKDVDMAMERILASRCHKDIQVIGRGFNEVREFEGWHMAFCMRASELFQVMANADWIEHLPVSRRNVRCNPALSLLIQRWDEHESTELASGDPVLSGIVPASVITR